MRTLWSLGIACSLIISLFFIALASSDTQNEQVSSYITSNNQQIPESSFVSITLSPTQTIYLPIVQKPVIPGTFLGKIAFSSYRTGNEEIFSTNADGSDLIKLTNDSHPDSSPHWSPDNKYIVYTKTHDSENSEIYRINADGTNPINLTNHPGKDFQPVWSPDGSKIAFTSYRNGEYDIYVMNSDGSNPTNLTNSIFLDQSPDWSPDGTKMIFIRDDFQIYIMNADGSNQVEFLATPGTFYGGPKWSPDGTKIAYYARDASILNTENIFTIDVDGTNITQLTTFAPSSSPTWSPDGTQIAFMSDRGEGYEIFVMNADGNLQQNITDDPTLSRIPSWSH